MLAVLLALVGCILGCCCGATFIILVVRRCQGGLSFSSSCRGGSDPEVEELAISVGDLQGPALECPGCDRGPLDLRTRCGRPIYDSLVLSHPLLRPFGDPVCQTELAEEKADQPASELDPEKAPRPVAFPFAFVEMFLAKRLERNSCRSLDFTLCQLVDMDLTAYTFSLDRSSRLVST